MRTVGILTIHQSTNCGASLQAFALYKTIGDLGVRQMLIDYRPSYFVSEIELANRGQTGVKHILKAALQGRKLTQTYELFSEFCKTFCPSITKPYVSREQLLEDAPYFDSIVCGSDQIWNPAHVSFDRSWMLDFAWGSGARLMSYAASIGKDTLNVSELDWLRSGACNLDHVGVREDTAVSVLKSMGIDAKLCLDPTLLVDAREWREMRQSPACDLPDRFIFYYPIEKSEVEVHVLRELKRKTGLPCVMMTDSLPQKIRAGRCEVWISGFGPRYFIDLMDRAEFVLTNSFHGLCFSIIFEKNLILYKNEKKNSRLDSMLRLLNAEGYQIEKPNDIEFMDLNEHCRRLRKSKGMLSALKEESLNYLSGVLFGLD